MGCYGDDKGARTLTFAYTASETMPTLRGEQTLKFVGALHGVAVRQ